MKSSRWGREAQPSGSCNEGRRPEWKSHTEPIRVRAVEKLSPFISAIVIGFYLSAAFLDCESTPRIPFARVSASESQALHHGDPDAAHGEVRNDSGDTGVMLADLVSPTIASAEHGGHTAHGIDREKTAEAAGQGHHSARSKPGAYDQHRAPERSRAVADFRDLRGKGLAFLPTCLCGCSETRSTIGGNASRLGSVVPGVFVARLCEPEAPTVEFSSHLLLVETYSDLDPIPI